jgi:hypothetical protein
VPWHGSILWQKPLAPHLFSCQLKSYSNSDTKVFQVSIQQFNQLDNSLGSLIYPQSDFDFWRELDLHWYRTLKMGRSSLIFLHLPGLTVLAWWYQPGLWTKQLHSVVDLHTFGRVSRNSFFSSLKSYPLQEEYLLEHFFGHHQTSSFILRSICFHSIASISYFLYSLPSSFKLLLFSMDSKRVLILLYLLH